MSGFLDRLRALAIARALFLFGNLKKPELVPVLCGRINLLRKKKVLRDNLQEK